jgi:hypothetical protein
MVYNILYSEYEDIIIIILKYYYLSIYMTNIHIGILGWRTHIYIFKGMVRQKPEWEYKYYYRDGILPTVARHIPVLYGFLPLLHLFFPSYIGFVIFCFFTFILSFELQCPPIFPLFFLMSPLFLSLFFLPKWHGRHSLLLRWEGGMWGSSNNSEIGRAQFLSPQMAILQLEEKISATVKKTQGFK